MSARLAATIRLLTALLLSLASRLDSPGLTLTCTLILGSGLSSPPLSEPASVPVALALDPSWEDLTGPHGSVAPCTSWVLNGVISDVHEVVVVFSPVSVFLLMTWENCGFVMLWHVMVVQIRMLSPGWFTSYSSVDTMILLHCVGGSIFVC
jgi:hypothetical protein